MEEIFATADELRQVTKRSIEQNTRSLEQLSAEWFDWFTKRGVRLLKDATSAGRYHCTLHIPYQPLTREHKQGLTRIKRTLQAMLPGCAIEFMEEETYETPYIFILIDWSEPIVSQES